MTGAIFIDGASWAQSFSEQAKGIIPLRVDYDRLVNVLATMIASGQIVDMPHRFYYSTFRGSDTRASKRAFFNEIKKARFIVSEVPAKLYADGHYEDKGVDLAIALDAYRLVLQGLVDVVVLGTHDTDFVSLFDRLPPTCSAVVVGWKRSMGGELHQAARPIYLDDIWEQVRYEGLGTGV